MISSPVFSGEPHSSSRTSVPITQTLRAISSSISLNMRPCSIDMFAQLSGNGPDADQVPGAESSCRWRDSTPPYRRISGETASTSGALPAKRIDVVDGDPDRLVLEVALLDRHVLRFDPDLFQPADGDQGFFGAFLHALDQGRHGHQAGDPRMMPEHRQERAELVGPDLLEPDGQSQSKDSWRHNVLSRPSLPWRASDPVRPASDPPSRRSCRRESRCGAESRPRFPGRG